MAGGANEERTERIFAALTRLLDRGGAGDLDALYALLVDGRALEIVDPLLRRIVGYADLDGERLFTLANWLARRAPDREAVKVGISILGLFRGAAEPGVFLTLGRHDEFTLYAAVALANVAQPPDEALWELARSVSGWGRIQAVERMAGTDDPRIKGWLLREGYRNHVMYEYLALTCATAGDLRGALEAASVDDALLTGAGEILVALLCGGPAGSMDDYADGAAATARYLDHLAGRATELSHFLAAQAIAGFLAEEDGWEARQDKGWTPTLRAALRARCDAILSLPRWREQTLAGLDSRDRRRFQEADRVAGTLGIDTWERHFALLQEEGGAHYFTVMQTEDLARADRVLALAERQLPLSQIASGPAQEMGMGPAFAAHRDLDLILQELGRFPGRGWRLIEAGLRSPVIRNRHLALRALADWGRARWPAEAADAVAAALAIEPAQDMREKLARVLAGRPMEDPEQEAIAST